MIISPTRGGKVLDIFNFSNLVNDKGRNFESQLLPYSERELTPYRRKSGAPWEPPDPVPSWRICWKHPLPQELSACEKKTQESLPKSASKMAAWGSQMKVRSSLNLHGGSEWIKHKAKYYCRICRTDTRPGRSTKASWTLSLVKTTVCLERVVWALPETAQTRQLTSILTREDFPTLGKPTTATFNSRLSGGLWEGIKSIFARNSAAVVKRFNEAKKTKFRVCYDHYTNPLTAALG